MASPTQLSYAECLDTADLTVHASTDCIIGIFMASTPSPTLEGVAMEMLQQSTNISIYQYKLPPTGALTLGGGTPGFFYCLQNAADGVSLSGKRTLNGLITLATQVGDLCIAAMDTTGTSTANHYIREDDTVAFTYSRKIGDDTIGYRAAVDTSMGAYFREDEATFVVSGAVLVVIPYVVVITSDIKTVNGVARASIKKVSGVALASIKKISGVA